jgi:hypothetical protein
MPASAKLVIGVLITLLVLNMLSVFAHIIPSAGALFAIVVQIALLTGLYARQTVAWYAARWLSGFAVLCDALILMVAFTATGTTAALIWSTISSLALACGLFCLLGRHDSRTYFNAPHKA